MATSLAAVFDDIAEDLDEFADEFMDEFLERVADKTPVDTGTLRDGWEISGMELLTDVDYWEFVEFGTIHNNAVGMVRRTVAERQRIADKIAKRVGRMK